MKKETSNLQSISAATKSLCLFANEAVMAGPESGVTGFIALIGTPNTTGFSSSGSVFEFAQMLASAAANFPEFKYAMLAAVASLPMETGLSSN